MSLLRRPARASAIAVLGLALTAGTGAWPASASASGAPGLAALSGSMISLPAVHAVRTGSYRSAQMSVEVALAPRDQPGLDARLKAQYTKGNASYHHWLAKGQFDSLYAPPAATRARVDQFLAGSGLKVQRSSSPFLVRAEGSSQQVSAAFGTTLSTYRGSDGRFFANSSAVRLPASMARGVLGVIGLSDTVRNRPSYVVAKSAKPATSATSCQTSYPTDTQIFDLYNDSTTFPIGYGGGPACSGLTPSQVNSIYDAPRLGADTKGAGVTVALIEFTAYQASDTDTWAHYYYGSSYVVPPLDNVNVDGGSLNPQCPSGDPCPPSSQGYIGDVEADLDIQRELTVAPDVAKVITYDTPNDTTGQTGLDAYTQIADDDLASTVSSSWSSDEALDGAAYVQSENTVFEQMAAQGQSMFADAGDYGPVAEEPFDGTTSLSLMDPSGQPWVTSVGGTSLENFNPGTNATPQYPTGVETVWNVDSLCQASSTVVGGQTGYTWCEAPSDFVGGGNATGGGSSLFWGRPSYQTGPGVTSSYTTYGNGSGGTQCTLATVGTPCRETPDVSADADPYTAYSTYCVGSASEVNSGCYQLAQGGTEADTGWFSVGGTSSATPLWAAIAADRDSYTGSRAGFFNPLLYSLFNTDASKYFNDITGAAQSVTTNGEFPVTPGYDQATGLGTPKMTALITESS